MNAKNKAITTYAKSLFQNLIAGPSTKINEEMYDVAELTSMERKETIIDAFIVGEELLLIRAILISSEKLKSFFSNPTYSDLQKVEIIVNIFPGLSPVMKSFLNILSERSHISLIPEISEEYTRLVHSFKKIAKVKMIFATPLKSSFGSVLLKKLKNFTNSDEVILNVEYNPKLLGGFILEYNSTAIDASILKEFSLIFSDL